MNKIPVLFVICLSSSYMIIAAPKLDDSASVRFLQETIQKAIQKTIHGSDLPIVLKPLSPEDRDYFDTLGLMHGAAMDDCKKISEVANRDNTLSKEEEKTRVETLANSDSCRNKSGWVKYCEWLKILIPTCYP